MQFEAKTYKNQSKGFTEVTGNFIINLLIKSLPKTAMVNQKKNKIKKKIPKAKIFFQNLFQTNFHCLNPLKTSENLNLWFSDIFRGFRSGTLTLSWHVNHYRIS